MRNERLSWSRSSNPPVSTGQVSTGQGSAAQSNTVVRSSGAAGDDSRAQGAGMQGMRVATGTAQKTSISSGCGIKGELYFTGTSELHCRIEGEVAAEGDLTIAESAQVLGDIRAERLMIFGAVSGDIVCSERIELHAGARVTGSICSPRVVMHDGVQFEGSCTMPSPNVAGETTQSAVGLSEEDFHSPEEDIGVASTEERRGNE